MPRKMFKSAWGKSHDSDAAKASSENSYHDGGVGGEGLSFWYGKNLSGKYNSGDKDGLPDEPDDKNGSGSGGTKGSGSGGTKGSGSGGTKGSGSGGTKGSGSGGTKGSGSGGTKGSGSGGTKGSGSGGTKGSGSGGTKGSGSGGTKGSGSGGTKGSGSGGTKGSGSGGTKGSGDCGTGGKDGGDTGGGKGGGDNGGGGDTGKTTVTFTAGGENDPQVSVEVTQTPEGNLFFKLEPVSWEGEVADIDGIFFNFTDDATAQGLNFYPDENALPVTGHDANPNAVNTLDNGAGVPENFDGMVQFGQAADSTEGTVTNANFTLWSDNGPLSLDDIDLSSMSLVVNSDGPDGQVLTGGVSPGAAASTSDSYVNGGVEGDGLADWYDNTIAGNHESKDGGGGEGGQDEGPTTEDIMALMNQSGTGRGASGSASGHGSGVNMDDFC